MYKLLKAMKVQKADGTIEQRQPGDPCPEAADWPNAQIWVNRGHIAPTTAASTPGYDRGKLKPVREATLVDAQRGMNTPVPKAGKELPGYKGNGDVSPDAGDDTPDLPDEYDSKSELMSLGRGDLEALAAEHGVKDPASYPNKGALSAAVLAAQGDAE